MQFLILINLHLCLKKAPEQPPTEPTAQPSSQPTAQPSEIPPPTTDLVSKSEGRESAEPGEITNDTPMNGDTTTGDGGEKKDDDDDDDDSSDDDDIQVTIGEVKPQASYE